MPILTYVTRVEVGEPAVLDGGTTFSRIDHNSFYRSSTSVYSTQHLVMGNNSTLDVTIHSSHSRTGSFLSTQTPSWSYATTITDNWTTFAKIVSYNSTAITFHSTFSQNVTNWTVDQGFRSTYSQADDDNWGATEVEAFGTVNNVLQYSFSRTSQGRQTVARGYTGTTGGGTSSTTPGTSSSTSYTSSAGKFFRSTARVNVSTSAGLAITTRYVTSSSTRTHTLTYGGSITYTYTTTVNPAFTIILTVTRTSTSFPGSQSVTVTQLVPVTSSRIGSKTVSSFSTGGSHYHFSGNPQTVYGNLVVYDNLTTTNQRIALGASTTGYQYASQLLAGGTGYSTTFSFVYGEVGGSTFGQPSGSTGTLTLVHDSYAPAGATASFVYSGRLAEVSPGSWNIIPLNFSEARAVLTPVTITQTTGQSFAAASTSSSVVGISSRSTTFGYVTLTGVGTLSTTLAKTLWEALGTTTSSRTMRLLASSTSASTVARSFTLGSTQAVANGTHSTADSMSQTSIAHGTVNRAFYNQTTSFSEHAANVPASRFSQQVLIGPFIHAPSATHAHNSINNVLMFNLSTYAAHDGSLAGAPIGLIPLSGTTRHSNSYYTQAYSISSNSTSLSFTYRPTSADASQTSTSSHLKTMAGSFAPVTIHGNNHSATLDSTIVRSFPSGTGGAYQTGGSEAHLMETPSFVASAIHGTVGLNGTAGYNLEHDLVYGSGTAGSIRNAGTGTSSFPVSRSVASQRVFYGRRIFPDAPGFSDCAPFFTESTINSFRTVAPQ